jgi:hypothetical protein
VQPLGEEAGEIQPGDLFRHGAEGGLVHVPVAPPLVEGAQDPLHDFVAHQIAELMEEQLSPDVDRLLIGVEVAIRFRRKTRRLR